MIIKLNSRNSRICIIAIVNAALDIKFTKRKAFSVLIFVLAAALSFVVFLPLLYKVPYFDDWYFAEIFRSKGLIAFSKEFYFTWGGRYSSIFFLGLLSAPPDTVLYKIVPVLFFVANISVYALIILQVKWIEIQKRKAWLLSFIFFVLYYSNLVEPFSGVFWHCSSFYLLTPLFFGVLVYVILKDIPRIIKACLIGFVVFVNAGMSEVLILMQGLLLFWLVLFYWKNSRLRNLFTILLILATVASLINLLAPGNFVRTEVNSGEVQFELVNYILGFFKSIYYLITMDFGNIGILKNGFLVVIFIYGLIRVLPKKVQFPEFSTRFFNFLVISFVLAIFILHLLFNVVAGYPMAGRVGNVVQFFYLIGGVVFLLLFEKMYLKNLFSNVPDYKNTFLAILAIFMFALLVSGNRKEAITSVLTELPMFSVQYNELAKDIRTNQDYNSVQFEVQPKVFQLNFHPDTLNEFNSLKYRNEMKIYFSKK